MKEITRKTIKMYQKDNGECPVIQWLESLDDSVRYRIKSRFARVNLGNLSEYKMLGEGIGELKFQFGSGYRVYFGEFDERIILLFCGGDKRVSEKGNIPRVATLMPKLKSFYGDIFANKLSSADLKNTVI